MKKLEQKQTATLEISIEGQSLKDRDKKVACRLFEECKIPENEWVCTDYQDQFKLSYYPRSATKACQTKQKLLRVQSSKLKVVIKILKRKDWFDKWKKDYHIRPLGTRFLIVPVWEKHKFKPCKRMPVFLDPGSAFGSGGHETTRLMVRFLELFKNDFQTFLDIGTGTGILSIVASKLGASEVVGFDNDKPSAAAARKNFELNRCAQGTFFRANLKNYKTKSKFKVVGANLLSKTLLKYKKQITDCVQDGGHLIVSGIGKKNLKDFQKDFCVFGFKRLKILRSRNWAAILYRKRAP